MLMFQSMIYSLSSEKLFSSLNSSTESSSFLRLELKKRVFKVKQRVDGFNDPTKSEYFLFSRSSN